MTQVKFLIEKDFDFNNPETFVENHILAFFPNEKYNSIEPNVFTCYQHIGQHSACHIDYAKECKEATPEQYADLLAELKGQGYDDLEIINP